MSRQPAVSHHGSHPVRFGLGGSTGVAVNMATLYLLAGIGHLKAVVAGAIATQAAILSNFVLDDRWNYTANSHLTWLKAARRMPPLGASLDRTVEPVD